MHFNDMHYDGLAILGPTGIGKTAISIAVAKIINGEIIGLDSRQIYKGMEIGTAQPSAEEQNGIPHHLIGVRDPRNDITAGEYAALVIKTAREIKKRGRLPIICGGAGLYFRALTQGLFKDSSTFPQIRERLNREYEIDGGVDLLRKLKKLDPEYAKIVHRNNKKRLVRAFEVYEGTGIVPTEHFEMQKKGRSDRETLNLFSVLLMMDRELLQERIKERTRLMFEMGWVNEVGQLLDTYKNKLLPPLDSIGYIDIMKYLNDEKPMDEVQEEIIIKTRQYAKRQVQWFLKENIDHKLQLSDRDTLTDSANMIVSKLPFKI